MLALPVLMALAASIQTVSADCADNYQCHVACGGMARDARLCGPDQATYDGPYNHSCLCDADSEFMGYLDYCLSCGWSLWSGYGKYLTSALAECSLPTEPTVSNSCTDSSGSSDDTTTTSTENTTSTDATLTSTDAGTTATKESTDATTISTASTEANSGTTSTTETTTKSTKATTESTQASSESASTQASSSGSDISTYSGSGLKLTLSSGLIAVACALLV